MTEPGGDADPCSCHDKCTDVGGRYSTVARALHWFVALAVVRQLTLGFSLESIPRAERGPFVAMHKSLGLTILLLSLARLGWRPMHKPPPLPRHETVGAAAGAGHARRVLRAADRRAAGRLGDDVSVDPRAADLVVGSVRPKLPIGKSDAVTDQLFAGHIAAAWLLVLLLVLHLGGVLKHMFLDDNDVLWRMVPFLGKPLSA